MKSIHPVSWNLIVLQNLSVVVTEFHFLNQIKKNMDSLWKLLLQILHMQYIILLLIWESLDGDLHHDVSRCWNWKWKLDYLKYGRIKKTPFAIPNM